MSISKLEKELIRVAATLDTIEFCRERIGDLKFGEDVVRLLLNVALRDLAIAQVMYESDERLKQLRKGIL